VYRLATLFTAFLTAAAIAYGTQTPPEGLAAALSREVRETGLDAQACYRVRDMVIARDELKFYINDGFVIFAKPIRGLRMGMFFSGDIEGGDAEVLLTPPHRGERRSLAAFTESPTLNEHFKTALFLFTDGSGEELLEQARAKGEQSLPMGLLLSSNYSPTIKNLSESFELRFLLDIQNPARKEQGLFFATVGSQKLGAFDLVYDPMAREQITTGKFVTREDRSWFDVWSSFEAQSFRTGRKKRPEPVYRLDDFRIDATLRPDLNLQVTTTARLAANTPGVHVFAFEMTERMQIQSVTIDGKPAEVFRRQSLRANAIRPSENSVFLIFAPKDFDSSKPHEITFVHEGQVILKAGDRVFFVSSRGTWYPHMRGEFSRYDLTFRYPKELDLVSSGDVVETKVEGDQRITRRKTPEPIRFAGFNLGEYENVKITKAPYTIEVYGNKRLEMAMMPKPPLPPPPQMPQFGGGRRGMNATSLPPPPTPDPLGQLKNIATTVAGAFESMTAELGPPPIKTLTVAPIPGSFGQGFPGLVYLSTMSYLSPNDLPATLRERSQQLFYSELLAAHEVAHQWWGNSVTASGYQDEWLQEALANYSALLYVERRKGAKAIEPVLADYRRHLLTKDENGNMIDSAGPITLGIRLQNSQTQAAWRIITYEKGTWILHMLRKLMGDAPFQKMLGHITREFKQKPFSTEDLRRVASTFLPPKHPDPQLDVFLENWLSSSGIPTLKHAPKVSTGLKVSGTITQTGVGEEFEADIPIEVQYVRGGPAQTFWVRTSTNEPVDYSFALKQPAAKVTIGAALLRAD
jgi:hypothetical protein